MYNGKKINDKLAIKEQVNEIDNKRKKMNLLVCDNEGNNNKDKKLIKSSNIICEKCNENIKFKNRLLIILLDIFDISIFYEQKLELFWHLKDFSLDILIILIGYTLIRF